MVRSALVADAGARGGERDDVGRDRARDARARARWGRPRDARARGDGGVRDARVGCETVRERRARREASDRGRRARGEGEAGVGGAARGGVGVSASAEASGDGASSSSMGLDAGRSSRD